MNMELMVHILKSIIEIIFQWFIGIIYSFLPKKLRYKSIKNELVLITGGANGIGQRLSLQLAKLGAHVCICDFNEDNLNNTKNLFNQYKELRFYYFKCDVSNLNQVIELQLKIYKCTNRSITMLINNAGIVNGKDFLKLSENQIRNILKVNVLANFWTTKTFLPNMIENNHGHIVSISSIAGLTGVSGLVDYCTSKYAVVGFEESLRNEIKSNKKLNDVHSTIVCPWFINTGMFNGVKSDIIAFLDVDYVVNEIISGILVNQEVIFIPKLIYILYPFKTVLPTRAMDALNRLFKSDQMMKSFIGRN